MLSCWWAEEMIRHGPMKNVKIRHGLIFWSWKCESISYISTLNQDHYWSLRLPLTTDNGEWGYLSLYRELDHGAPLLDLNYICSLFQRHVASAAERVLSAVEKEEDDVAQLELIGVSSRD
jgi:hypothetical protein